MLTRALYPNEWSGQPEWRGLSGSRRYEGHKRLGHGYPRYVADRSSHAVEAVLINV